MQCQRAVRVLIEMPLDSMIFCRIRLDGHYRLESLVTSVQLHGHSSLVGLIIMKSGAKCRDASHTLFLLSDV
jgi:hypothetical protein